MDTATHGRRYSPLSNIVKHRGKFCRILLVSPSSLHGVDLLEGWSLQQNEQRDCWPCQLVHCILNETMDGQSILSLISRLDRIRSGWFGLICLLPAAATWSRARVRSDGNGRCSFRLSGRGVDLVHSSGVELGGTVESPGSYHRFCSCAFYVG